MPSSEKLIRLIQILSQLSRSEGANVAKLSRRFHVTKRTIYRDLELLAEAGIPLGPDPVNKSHRLSSTGALRPLSFTLDEASALFHCLEGLCNTEQPLRPLLRQAQAKIFDAVDPALQEEFRCRPQSVDIRLISRLVSCDPKIYRPIHDAILHRQRLQLNYYAKSRNEKRERDFDPYIISYRGYAWYVIGFCHLEQQMKILRLDRISDIRQSEESFEIPVDFSLETFFAGSWNIEQGPLTHVKLKVSPEKAHHFRAESYHSSQKLEELPDGSLLFSVTVQGTKEISRFILGFGPGIEVVAPLGLRKQIRDQAKLIAEANR